MARSALTNAASTLLLLVVAGCSAALPTGWSFPGSQPSVPVSAAPSGSAPPAIMRFNNTQKECLVRAMYFESNRSSASGMLAVGTVVMNRVESSRFDNTICGVVGAPNQFASGVLTRPMTEPRPVALASSVADRILKGERHPGVRSAKFFHQAGLRFPYGNMRYVLEAGGNAFYIKG